MMAKLGLVYESERRRHQDTWRLLQHEHCVISELLLYIGIVSRIEFGIVTAIFSVRIAVSLRVAQLDARTRHQTHRHRLSCFI